MQVCGDPRAAKGVGSSNTPRRDTSVRGELVEVGVDTARILIPAQSQREFDRATEVLGYVTKPDALNGLQAGFIRSGGLIWVEGRFVRMADEHSTDLLQPDALGDVTELVRKGLGDLNIGQGAAPKFSRIDTTATVALSKPSEGFALLRGMRGLEVPRRKTMLIEKHGKPETVSFITGHGEKKETVYDKGVERGTESAGSLVRFEVRNRFTKPQRETAKTWTAEHLRDEFRHRMQAMAKSSHGVTSGSESAVRETLREFAEVGTITARHAELLMGHIAAESVGLKTHPKTAQRRRAEFRRLGLALALDGDDESVSVDLGAVLDEVLTGGDW